MQNRWIRSKSLAACLVLALHCFFMAGCASHAQVDQKAVQAGPKGSFQVVGIGPGDADLLTSRALEAIRKADLVFCRKETQEKLASYVDFAHKQTLDGYGVLFRYCGKDCSQVSEEDQAHGYPKDQEAPLASCRPVHLATLLRGCHPSPRLSFRRYATRGTS